MVLNQLHLGFQPMQGLPSAVGKVDAAKGAGQATLFTSWWACSQDDLSVPEPATSSSDLAMLLAFLFVLS